MDSIKVLDYFIQLNPLGEIYRIAQRREIAIQGQRNPEIRIKIIKELIAEKIEHLDAGARDGIEVGTSPYSDVLSLTLVEPDSIEAKKCANLDIVWSKKSYRKPMAVKRKYSLLKREDLQVYLN